MAAKPKYVIEVVLTTGVPMLKKDVKTAVENALAQVGTARVRSVDRD